MHIGFTATNFVSDMPKDTKSKTVLFRLSQSDHERLLQAAGDLTLSAYLRSTLLEGEIKKIRTNKRPLKDQEQLSLALGKLMQSRLSPNINQIAKAVNCGMVIMPDEAIDTLNSAQSELTEIRNLLLSALGKKAP
ncbi:hypothetical protein [Alteromonas sp. a30]|uniref:hypothetical protein n=1 Tax=Alteromonas sp. a30 TaxID=2730917 RepID=UPI002282593F|nr:hypothetical protein [Alteromonas sp. a30]MCY7297419.1 hypothetical protein [Alteromonas sp. a30]